MWKVTFTQDTEKPGVGTMAASYSDATSLAISYSNRVDTSQNLNPFIAAAQAALAEKQAAIADAAAICASVEAALNGV